MPGVGQKRALHLILNTGVLKGEKPLEKLYEVSVTARGAPQSIT